MSSKWCPNFKIRAGNISSLGKLKELESDNGKVTIERTNVQQGAHTTNSAVWQVPYACAQPYHPGSGSHGQLFHQHGIAPGEGSHLRSQTPIFTHAENCDPSPGAMPCC